MRLAHEKKMGQPSLRRIVADKPKEEEYFYANPQECLCEKFTAEKTKGDIAECLSPVELARF